MTITGKATISATKDHLDQFPQLLRSRLGKTGLSISQAGLGMYRMADGVPDHHQSVADALANGVNVFDTSSNYTDGASEVLLGKALATYFESGGQRDGLVLVSKAGYLQGHILEEAYKMEAIGEGYQDLVMMNQTLSHCIHPNFLEVSLTKTLERLGVETLDVFLLHNPEYYLMWAEENGQPVDEVRAILERRIHAAFTYLESEVQRGRIQSYGLSSNTLGYEKEHAHFLSLEGILSVQESFPHFSVIETPVNLLETGFITQRNSGSFSSFQIAKAADLGILANRPLNAIFKDQLYRLISLETDLVPEVDEISELVQALEAKESLFLSSETVQSLKEEEQEQLKLLLNLGQTFQSHWQNCHGYEHWKDLLAQFFFPQVEHTVQYLQTILPQNAEAVGWLQGYLQRFADTAQNITAWYKCHGRGFRDQLVEKIHTQLPDWAGTAVLEALAIRFLRSTEGISSTLVGMRLPDYVETVVTELAEPFPQTITEEDWQKWAKETVFSR